MLLKINFNWGENEKADLLCLFFETNYILVDKEGLLCLV